MKQDQDETCGQRGWKGEGAGHFEGDETVVILIVLLTLRRNQIRFVHSKIEEEMKGYGERSFKSLWTIIMNLFCCIEMKEKNGPIPWSLKTNGVRITPLGTGVQKLDIVAYRKCKL